MPADWSTGSVSNFAYFRLNDVPTDISGTVMNNYADESRLRLQAVFDTTISSTAIDDRYKTILVDMTCAYTLARMAQIGVDFDTSIGEFSTSAGNSANYDARIKFYTDSAEQGIKAIGRPTRFYQAFY